MPILQLKRAQKLGLELNLDGADPKDRGRWIEYSREKYDELAPDRFFLKRNDDGVLEKRDPPKINGQQSGGWKSDSGSDII